MIHPPDDLEPEQAFVFANIGGMTASVCAPRAMTKEQVEKFTCESGAVVEPVVAFDRAELGGFEPTPNPCDHDPNRQHWFLVAPSLARRIKRRRT